MEGILSAPGMKGKLELPGKITYPPSVVSDVGINGVKLKKNTSFEELGITAITDDKILALFDEQGQED